MESEAEGNRGHSRFEALYEEAKAVVGYGANQLRALTERARELRGEPGHDPVDVDRLEGAVADTERIWMALEQRRAVSLSNVDAPTSVLQAQQQERRRIARELHDGPAQALANLVFRLDIAARLLDQDAAGARTALSDLRAALNAQVASLRVAIDDLQPRELSDAGLDAALRNAADELAPDHSVGAELTAPASALDASEQVAVLRIAQEALRNVRKHARARHVALRTYESNGAWLLEVSNDGDGFDVAAASRSTSGRHFGLRFMRERAESVGGQLTIDSGPTGTRVRLTITPSGERSSAW